MKNILKIFVIILLFGCQKIESGRILSKWNEPERHYTMLIPVSTGKTMVLIPYYVHDNEDFLIKVQGISDKGDTITKTFYVSKNRYDTISIGDFICIDGNCNDVDNNNTKERK